MKNFKMLTMAIVLLTSCAVLASIVGTADAADGIRTGDLQWMQPSATSGPAISSGTGAGGNIGTPYAVGGPSRCIGIVCTADWIGTSVPMIGSGMSAGGSDGVIVGTIGTGQGYGLNIPVGSYLA